MAMRKLIDYLKEKKVDYNIISHEPAYTSQQIAQSAHIPGRLLAKTVIVKLDGKLSMVVLPATIRLDLDWLRENTHSESAILAREYEFSNAFPDCETGAFPPFGNLFDMDVYIFSDLTQEQEIAFNAGNHNELIKMSFADFKKIVKPKLLKWH